MTWVRVDDHFDEHPKLAQVGPAGWGIWLAGLAYCNRNLTDGFIPKAIATRFKQARVIAELVRVGLWEPVTGGYRVHDFYDYQPSKDKVLGERKRGAERQSRHRNAQSNGVSNGDRNGVTAASVTDASQARNDGPVPVPLKEEPNGSSRRAPRTEDEKATDEDKALCRLLAEQMRARNPKAKIRSRSRWLTDMRLLRERDDNSAEEIEKAIRWVFDDQFWGGVIQSPGNLREHFAQVWDKMHSLRAVPDVESSEAMLRRRGAA